MDAQQARMHFAILGKRVASLEKELEGALKLGNSLDEQIKKFHAASKQIDTNLYERNRDLEVRFNSESNNYKKELKLAEEVLERKKEERQALMGYLAELDLQARCSEDLRDFDWESLEKMAENIHKPGEHLMEQRDKVEHLDELIQAGRSMIQTMDQVLTPTESTRYRLMRIFEEFKNNHGHWNRVLALQNKKMKRIECDNERLNVLIRQCIATNEPMSDYITKNIQAKCQSFLNSDNSQELLEGLRKFKSRQQRMIKLLQYKDNQLGSEINKLEVAKDQTHDQVKFYLKIIADKRNKNLTTTFTSDRRHGNQTQPVIAASPG